MKNSILMILVAASMVLNFNACNNSSTPKQDIESTSDQLAMYSCPMHPEVQSDKPGKCPKCKMDLVKMTDNDSTMHHHTDSMNMN